MNNIKLLKASLIEKLQVVIVETEKNQKIVMEKYLDEWHKSQKLAANGGQIATPASLDTIQEWFEILAYILWHAREQIKMLQVYVNIDEQVPDVLPQLLEKVTKSFENFIIRAFIIERQPLQVITMQKK